MRELLGGKGSTWDEGWKKHDEDEKRLYENILRYVALFVWEL